LPKGREGLSQKNFDTQRERRLQPLVVGNGAEASGMSAQDDFPAEGSRMTTGISAPPAGRHETWLWNG